MLLVLLAAKAAVLLLDADLRLFMGDSASYLHAALHRWHPPDRSLVYPWLVAASAVATGSALGLVLLQSLLGVAGCLLVAGMLRMAGISRALAAAAALALALEPSQLFYERMLMAESAGLLSLLVLVAATAAYVADGRWRWLPVLAASGVLAVGFRMSLLPVVLGLAALTPLLRGLYAAGPGVGVRAGLRHAVWPALLVLAWVSAAHGLYRQAYGWVQGAPPGYLVAGGQMRLGLVAPLVRPAHLDGLGLPDDFIAGLAHPLGDHRSREAQIWAQGGAWPRLEEALGPQAAQAAAHEIASRALRDDPLGLVRLGVATVGDYFDDSIAEWRLLDDAGARAPDAGTLETLRSRLGYDASGIASRPGPVRDAFVASRWWLTALLFAQGPLALACLVLGWRSPRARALAWVVGFTGLGLVAGHLLFSHIVSFRYLHPLPALFVLALALCVGARGAPRGVAPR